MTMTELKLKLSVLPTEPGCYLMKDKYGEILYVGKAKNLRNRVRSYFTGAHDEKTMRLVREITDFDFIVTSTEVESLLLELNLIKKHYPRYNILLKDERSEEQTSELQSRFDPVCRLILEKKKKT